MMTSLLHATDVNTRPRKVTPSEHSSSVDLSRLLTCIAEVESGNRDDKVGSHGERSRYQITEVVWKQHTTLPFDRCHGFMAEYVARKHLLWLVENGVTPLPFPLALAWNGGLERWKAGKVFQRHHNYASRVNSLYQNVKTRS
jgi:hypothetical protein